MSRNMQRISVEVFHWEPLPPEVKKRHHSPNIVVNSDFLLLCSGTAETSWSLSNLYKAASILADCEERKHFQDKKEMHTVYSLLYAVFRYKNILQHILQDTEFFIYYPQFEECKSQVCLFLYDLYKRRFLPRETSKKKEDNYKLLKKQKLFNIEESLWKERVHMAASIARLRIKNNVLTLSQLLPPRLRDEHACSSKDEPLAVWVNTHKISVEDISQIIQSSGSKYSIQSNGSVNGASHRWDSVLPDVLLCDNKKDVTLSQILQGDYAVIEDRSFCLGPAVMATLLKGFKLTGNIIQTHVISPQSTAYFATILATNEDIHHLFAFGAGNRWREYEKYLQEVGVDNTTVLAEQFLELKSNSHYFNEVSAILATPPNTYSAISNPVEFVCDRGGDLSMLELLAADTECDEISKKRVDDIVEKQLKTLHTAMEPPQIKIVLYKTHSSEIKENKDVVQEAIKLTNMKLHEKHVEDSLLKNSAEGYFDLPPHITYEQGDLASLTDLNLNHEGCYLALIKRKEIIIEEPKFMINLAETLDSYERKILQSLRKRHSHKRKPEKIQKVSSGKIYLQPGSQHKVEMGRIAAPTLSSLLREASNNKILEQQESDYECPRLKHHEKIACMSKHHHKKSYEKSISSSRHLKSLKEQDKLIKRLSMPTQSYLNHRKYKKEEGEKTTHDYNELQDLFMSHYM